jgi:transposase
MRQKSVPSETAEQHVREIRCATRKLYSAEEKIRIVLSGLRREYAIVEVLRTRGLKARERIIEQFAIARAAENFEKLYFDSRKSPCDEAHTAIIAQQGCRLASKRPAGQDWEARCSGRSLAPCAKSGGCVQLQKLRVRSAGRDNERPQDQINIGRLRNRIGRQNRSPATYVPPNERPSPEGYCPNG